MTDRELLELLVKSVNNINIRLDRMEADITELKEISAKHGGAIADLQLAVSRLEAAQLRTSATLESTVDKCVQVLYETHTLNAERLDKFDIESIKNNSEIAATLAKTTYDTIMNRLKAV